jgi:uncharacterized protein (TIGR02246 family)
MRQSDRVKNGREARRMNDPAVDDFQRVIERNHAALHAFMHGDPDGFAQLYSHRDDVTLGNPFGPFVRGFDRVVATIARAARNYREGEVVDFEMLATHVTPDLGATVEVERLRAKVGGHEDVATVSIRCTSIFRREEDGWRLVHRHADGITSDRPAESIVQP